MIKVLLKRMILPKMCLKVSKILTAFAWTASVSTQQVSTATAKRDVYEWDHPPWIHVWCIAGLKLMQTGTLLGLGPKWDHPPWIHAWCIAGLKLMQTGTLFQQMLLHIRYTFRHVLWQLQPRQTTESIGVIRATTVHGVQQRLHQFTVIPTHTHIHTLRQLALTLATPAHGVQQRTLTTLRVRVSTFIVISDHTWRRSCSRDHMCNVLSHCACSLHWPRTGLEPLVCLCHITDHSYYYYCWTGTLLMK